MPFLVSVLMPYVFLIQIVLNSAQIHTSKVCLLQLELRVEKGQNVLVHVASRVKAS